MSPLRRLFPGRFLAAGVALAAFLAVSLATRLALLAFNGDGSLAHPAILVPALAIGPLHLGDLPEGKWRALTNAERDALVRESR